MRKIYIVLILLTILSAVAYGQNGSTYRTYVDNYHGFYRVYNVTSDEQIINYRGNILNINKGDTVIWSNEATDGRLTIVSTQKLWDDKDGSLPWSDRRFLYTFNKSGIYEVYLKQNSKLRQKIIVGPLELDLPTNQSVKANTTKTNPTINSTTNSTIDISKTKSNSTTSMPVVKVSSKESVASLGIRPGFEVLAFIIVASLLIFAFDRRIK